MSTFRELLVREVAPFYNLSEEQALALQTHYELLVRWNRKLNLTAIRSLEEVVRLHYAESVFLASVVGDARNVVDVGSGGGFPGVPFAICRPDVAVTLVESHQRKAVFLRESTRSVANVAVRSVRFEAMAERFDLCISRAVAWEDFAAHALTITDRIALLVSEADAQRVVNDGRVSWVALRPLPWLGRGCVALGHVPRETE